MVHYPWHPLHGRTARCVLIERRASGEIANVELEPGIVTKVAAWKLEPVHCATLKIGAPRASVAALSDLHGLLIACESRLPSANGNTVTQEGHDGIADTARTSNAAGFETEVGSLDNTAPARSRSRRRSTSRHDPGGASNGSQGAGPTAARGKRRPRRRRSAMTAHDALLPASVLQRKAIVYVRQSTPQQVQANLESQRRQYELVDVARRRGFTNVEVIDDDLGRTASGAVERPGFRALGRGAVRRAGRRGALPRCLAACPQWPRLAPSARAVRTGGSPCHRSRRYL